MRRRVLVATMTLVALMVPSGVAPGSSHAVVKGTVTLDGAPLEGVEVFLWDATAGKGKYRCTDKDGFYKFGGIDPGDGFFLAVGPATAAEHKNPCSNPNFVNPANGKDLFTKFNGGPHGVREVNPFSLTSGQKKKWNPDLKEATVPVCFGYKATHDKNGDRLLGKGTAGTVLKGTNDRDVIIGSNGPDDIWGRSGDDIICGRKGADEVRPGKGFNVVDGDQGKDLLVLKKWAPGKNANTGFMVDLDESQENGALFGMDGFAVALSGPEATHIRSFAGANGTIHNDTLIGDKNDNEFKGLEGQDFINGKGGTDDCSGGPGKDTVKNCE